jgi:hypothetical protein
MEQQRKVTIQPNTDLNDILNQPKVNNDAFKTDTSDLLEQSRIYPDADLQPPETLLSVINPDGTEGIIGTAGNFITIIGKAKSRKSFSISLFTSSLISEKPIYNKFKGTLLPEKNKVLLFDTEQAPYHLKCSLNRVLALAEQTNNDNFRVYKLRKYNPEQRLNIIRDAIYNTSNVGVVIIDGVRDLITSINSEEQATAITSEFLRWTEELNINLITVLHQNKGDANARGHIGTELMNKSETVLSVTKSEQNKNISIVKAEYCRDREPDAFAFEINKDGLPALVDNWEIKTQSSNEKLTLTNILLWKICQEIFNHGSSFKYSELVIQFKLAYKTLLSKTIGDNKAKEFITICNNEKMIIQSGNKQPYTIGVFNESTNL